MSDCRTLRKVYAPTANGACCIAFALVCSMSVASEEVRDSSDQAQQPSAGRPAHLFMLSNERIRKELGLSHDQETRILALHEEYVRAAREFRASTARVKQERREASVATLHATAGKRSDEFESRTAQILSAEQNARLEQLRLQARGCLILLEPSIRETLRVSEEQFAVAKRILEAHDLRCRHWAQEVGARKMSPEQGMKHVDEEMRSAHDQVLALLDEAQRRALQQLLGSRPNFDPAKLRYRLISKPAVE